ncbi:hypothetical protein GM415_10125 [Pseudodesulfovibrio cashew]|uniref:Uncharacterized protein n=1 Tax=Pseudodesulfovibrio cashew TaxID=2678688 RepID=A0A6I6JK28_9BACT|nr:hypothetical protein [Pseudodesulfovibrio cashew]QGY40467.1 hypothetical protein GM415_10125 [Pseudodesulfovibrio cashew]
MAKNEIALWGTGSALAIPRNANEPVALLSYSKQLSPRDSQQIVQALEAGSYEMASTFVLTKALTNLKRQLSSLGMDFIGEMLDRPDLDESSSAEDISSHEAITLAQELGIIDQTQAMRLKHSLDTVMHFASSDQELAEDEGMNQQEAILCLRSSIEAVLGHPKSDLPDEFVSFRDRMSNYTFKISDPEIDVLQSSPYFYKKTTLSILLSKLKTAKSAELEHAIGNTNIILPIIWQELRNSEKWQVGHTYRNVYSEGNEIATIGLKKALIKVNGFDFVPESLRSHSFLRAANKILAAHDGMNNFHNEPAPTSALASMGSTIPEPAFAKCMTAVFSVYLGNSWGHSWGAEHSATTILDRLSESQWTYFFNQCFPSDGRILEKLSWYDKPRDRWFSLVEKYNLSQYQPANPTVKKLLDTSAKRKTTATMNLSKKLLSSLSK